MFGDEEKIFTKEAIEEAHHRIQHYINKTPVLTSQLINQIAGCSIFFKCENFQKIGAFKMRGASNAILQLNDEEKKKGVVTHSSGNHAQAVAKSAQLLGIKSYIVMPKNAPEVKIAAVKAYGGIITFCEATLESRETSSERIIKEKGATFIHPFNNENVILGQATAAKELLLDYELDIIITPVGGGGLLSGSILSANYFGNNCLVYGAEPEGADDAFQSVRKGMLEPQTNPITIADGLLTSLGDLTFRIINKGVSDILLVSDHEIKAAMKLIWERMKIVIEPSAAVPFAAVLKNPILFKNKKVGIVISGGNIDLSKSTMYFTN